MCNVIIVDNDIESSEIMKAMIREHFANVILLPIATTRLELIEIADKYSIELAIINHDTLDCFKVHKFLLERFPNLKSIVTSRKADFKNAQKALRLGMIDYLLKPIDDDFIYALDRGIKSINQVSLLDIENNDNQNTSLTLQHKVLRFIHENYAESLTLDVLANYLNMSKYHVSRLVKSILGMNFSEYLLIYRVEVAKKELSTTDYPISEVAMNVGFNDSTYFTKKFKEVTGLTPKRYRQTYQGQVTIADVQV